MANTYFSFKQFTIHQSQSAMKVCTDSCVFGAYIPLESGTGSILDIGSGTGLLGLMMAQRTSSASIDGVEIDPAAHAQSCRNALESPFHGRVSFHQGDITDYSNRTAQAYDVIACNPPFFDNSLKSSSMPINQAMHSSCLKLHELVPIIHKLLKPLGVAWILLPPAQAARMQVLMKEASFHLNHRASLRDRPNTQAIRHILGFSRIGAPIKEVQIHFRTIEGQYSKEFVSLLKEYYLQF